METKEVILAKLEDAIALTLMIASDCNRESTQYRLATRTLIALKALQLALMENQR